jgi:hypothetical protein
VWDLSTIRPGEEVTLSVRVIPQVAGEIGSVAQATFQARAAVRTLCTQPRLALSVQAPESVLVGQSASLEITVTNTGNLALSGLAVSKDGTHPADFQIGTLTSATLDPAESLTLTVNFAPSNKGLRTANLRLASNDPTEPSFLIPLSGTGFFNSVTITQQPSSTAVAVGTPVALQVAATGTELIRYQWRRNGVTLKGATSPTLLLPSTTTSQSGSYSVVVSNPAGSVTSLSASLAVADINLKTLALPTGATLRLAAPISGTVSSYLWRQGSAAIPDNPRFTGWASKTLQITRLTQADAARYAANAANATRYAARYPADVARYPADVARYAANAANAAVREEQNDKLTAMLCELGQRNPLWPTR